MIEFDLSVFFSGGWGLYFGGAYFQNFTVLTGHFCPEQNIQNVSHARAFIPGKFMRLRSEEGIELNCKENVRLNV